MKHRQRKHRTTAELVSRLDSSYLGTLTPANDTGLRPSRERIRALALQKLGAPERKEQKMTRKTIRIFLIAAAVLLLSATALAIGGLDYFRGIFGDSAQLAKEDIVIPQASVQQDGVSFAAEAVLSDGYRTNVILSARGIEIGGFSCDGGYSVSCTELPGFSAGKTKYYRLEVSTLEESHAGRTLQIYPETQPSVILELPIDGKTAARTIETDVTTQGYHVDSIQLTPLGIQARGTEDAAKGGIPTVEVAIVMKDGAREDATMFFDAGDEESTVIGGGGAIIGGPGQQLPLVTGTQGQRNPDGELVMTGFFSRILDLGKVERVEVDGAVYPLG